MRLCTLLCTQASRHSPMCPSDAIIVLCDTFRSHSHTSVLNRRAPEVIAYNSEKTEDSELMSTSTTDGTTISRTLSFTPRENNFSLAPEASNILELSMKEYHDELDIFLQNPESILGRQSNDECKNGQIAEKNA